MPEFLTLQTPERAIDTWYEHIPIRSLPTETIPVVESLGRTSAEDIFAPESLPPFTRSSVDGYAVQARSTYGSSDALPTYLKYVGEVPMGQQPSFSMGIGEAALIHTGGMLPNGTDAVVMIEDTQMTSAGEVEVQKGIASGENILIEGEDVHKGQKVLEAGVKIRPVEIGGLLALGIMTIKVAKKPKVGILSSGDEVISPEMQPNYGQVRDINSYSLAALVEEAGGISTLYGIIPDNPTALFKSLKIAFSESDMVIITAGSSASTRDFTSEAINRLGIPGVLVHGINIRPGKPTILAAVEQKPLIGLPGNPISALVIARLFVFPMIEYLLGNTHKRPSSFLIASITTSYPSIAGRDEWIPVKITRQGIRTFAEPIFFKSNFIFNLSQADGLAHIPSHVTGLAAGEETEVLLL